MRLLVGVRRDGRHDGCIESVSSIWMSFKVVHKMEHMELVMNRDASNQSAGFRAAKTSSNWTLCDARTFK